MFLFYAASCKVCVSLLRRCFFGLAAAQLLSQLTVSTGRSVAPADSRKHPFHPHHPYHHRHHHHDYDDDCRDNDDDSKERTAALTDCGNHPYHHHFCFHHEDEAVHDGDDDVEEEN